MPAVTGLYLRALLVTHMNHLTFSHTHDVYRPYHMNLSRGSRRKLEPLSAVSLWDTATPCCAVCGDSIALPSVDLNMRRSLRRGSEVSGDVSDVDAAPSGRALRSRVGRTEASADQENVVPKGATPSTGRAVAATAAAASAPRSNRPVRIQRGKQLTYVVPAEEFSSSDRCVGATARTTHIRQ